MIALRSLTAIALLLPGCAFPGSTSLSQGRATYNAVINETEDEQLLSMIVSRRYDETFGMLAVAGVTANLRIGATVGANLGFGNRSGYEGNLVPLSAGVAYEENPTISYVPLRGEQFVERMLAPVSAEQALLLNRMSSDEVEVLRLLVRRANGLVNPLFSSQRATEGFDHFIGLYAALRERGQLDIVGTGDGGFELLVHDYAAEESAEVAELLRTLGIRKGSDGGSAIRVPLRFEMGTRWTDGVDLETPSALEIIEAAAAGVRVPEKHLSRGFARPIMEPSPRDFLTIHSSRQRPDAASVAVKHHGWWFFVDRRDSRSKRVFMIVRTLVGMRLDDAAVAQSVPILTVPVGR